MTGPQTLKHVPERTCVACRRKRPQGEFLRLTKVDGAWQLGQRPRQGRGAYLCADTPTCWQDKRLRRAFGAQATTVAELAQRTVTPGAPDS
ncbi:YlxR family protein [Deinococcus sp. HMF7604]|uniref:YlxR family protein n=1 Tax=Deinococcus betulae TaxID=2873312 RepID=UPI001CCEAD1B|nr:YlxR family protein [Deinococcus betulae]MBZ9749274.1 YlxR family protein [Deinococcus betulae]